MNKDSNNNDNIQDPLTDHEYDGIQEYDNPLPAWWLYTFLGTIIFAFFYWLHYSISSGPSLKDELASAMSVIAAHKAANAPKELTGAALDQAMKAANVEDGATQYTAKCAACHGAQLQGQIGPNLTDEYWLNGKGQTADIQAIIKKGVVEKGMPAWESMLTNEDVINIAAYIISKQDSHPAGAKAAQGEKVR